MALSFLHHLGSFLLLAATVLLIISCISAPVVDDIALLKIELGDQGVIGQDDSFMSIRGFRPTVTFGTFGYCWKGVIGQLDHCSEAEVGYRPAVVMEIADRTLLSSWADGTTRSLTKALVLHPIACGLNFIAFMLALGAGIVGSLLASLVALLAFVTTGVVLIIDFVLFGVVRSAINDRNTGAQAYYGSAAWTALVAGICSLLGAILLFFTCCSGRRRRSRNPPVMKEGVVEPVPRRRRRWGMGRW